MHGPGAPGPPETCQGFSLTRSLPKKPNRKCSQNSLSDFSVSKSQRRGLKHSRQKLSCFFGLVDVTLVQGTRVPSCMAQRLMELELDDEADEVPGEERRCGRDA